MKYWKLVKRFLTNILVMLLITIQYHCQNTNHSPYYWQPIYHKKSHMFRRSNWNKKYVSFKVLGLSFGNCYNPHIPYLIIYVCREKLTWYFHQNCLKGLKIRMFQYAWIRLITCHGFGLVSGKIFIIWVIWRHKLVNFHLKYKF